MDLEILAYLGAALMVVLAFLAYRYWHSTATYALRIRESRAHQVMSPPTGSALPGADSKAADVAAEEDDLMDPPPVDLLPEADDIASNEGAEEAHDPPPLAAGHGEELPEEPIAGVHEIEPAPVEDEPRQESVDDVAEDEDDGSFAEPGPQPDEADEGAGEPEAGVTDERIADDSAEMSTGSIEWNNGGAPPDLKTEHRLIEELEPRRSSARTVEAVGSLATLLKELDEQLAALPGGIELIDLPILERRRIADRREELLRDRERLLEQKKRGAHRRRKRSRTEELTDLSTRLNRRRTKRPE